jgi:predicted porin
MGKYDDFFRRGENLVWYHAEFGKFCLGITYGFDDDGYGVILTKRGHLLPGCVRDAYQPVQIYD